MVVRDGCEGWWETTLLCKIFKINSYFFPIFSGKFLFFSYFLGARIPIFLFFWPFLLLDALSVLKVVCFIFCEVLTLFSQPTKQNTSWLSLFLDCIDKEHTEGIRLTWISYWTKCNYIPYMEYLKLQCNKTFRQSATVAILNLLINFRCHHHRVTFSLSPVDFAAI